MPLAGLYSLHAYIKSDHDLCSDNYDLATRLSGRQKAITYLTVTATSTFVKDASTAISGKQPQKRVFKTQVGRSCNQHPKQQRQRKSTLVTGSGGQGGEKAMGRRWRGGGGEWK